MPLIRLATQADLPAIVEIYNSTVASRQVTADLQPVTVAQRQAWFDAHSGNRPLYVVQETAGGKAANAAPRILAWASLSNYYPRAAYDISAEVSIYIHEASRGAGLGKRLLAYVEQQAPALGVRNLIGVIFGHNTPSVRLFEAAGYTRWGLLPNVCALDGALADVVILGKALGPAKRMAEA